MTTKLALAAWMYLSLACGQSSGRPVSPVPGQPTLVAAPASAAEDEPIADRPVVAPADLAAEPVVSEEPKPLPPVPSAYTIDGVSVSSVPLAAIEKALKKAGCRRFTGRTTQTIGPYEYLSIECQIKRDEWRNTSFSIRRPALKPETTTIDAEQYSPARWQKMFSGELWDEPANVYVQVMIHADNASELSRPLFESIVKKP
ncbi:MAG: hypothetical protein H0T42_06805 [Deltaproteobacteria bacterium]|nr:hypothetical protein [Deltaproteobacteria bacterium]